MFLSIYISKKTKVLDNQDVNKTNKQSIFREYLEDIPEYRITPLVNRPSPAIHLFQSNNESYITKGGYRKALLIE